ncbi:ADP-ribose pyrophosphatase [Glaciihabitans tibetensis]|uniref:ADP-ribose pyrophosphatase n=1 Tax=Glaciihabitans tibetensis TaxID=1266600 RepID=A0A2T0VEM8_9MICO|nr:NUDIX hydrolase [Glaciihabitans tibetensis]PRY68641.1 ADP-ribose pyrophosphatase [Glaciihabitans tibetensis]
MSNLNQSDQVQDQHHQQQPHALPLADVAAAEDVVSSDVVFEGAVWNIRRDVVTYRDNKITREYVDHTGAVAVLALDDQNRVLLIQQYRHPVGMRDWELPAGLLDAEGESNLAAAQRELAEEVDLKADDWSKLVSFHTTPGGSNEIVHVFLARGISATPTFNREDEEADIVVGWVPLEDVVAAILAGSLTNSILMIAVLAAHARL